MMDYMESTDAQAWDRLRLDRNDKLAASDWTMLPDAPVDMAAWQAYRQKLRDLPANISDPHNVEWPSAPDWD